MKEILILATFLVFCSSVTQAQEEVLKRRELDFATCDKVADLVTTIYYDPANNFPIRRADTYLDEFVQYWKVHPGAIHITQSADNFDGTKDISKAMVRVRNLIAALELREIPRNRIFYKIVSDGPRPSSINETWFGRGELFNAAAMQHCVSDVKLKVLNWIDQNCLGTAAQNHEAECKDLLRKLLTAERMRLGLVQ